MVLGTFEEKNKNKTQSRAPLNRIWKELKTTQKQYKSARRNKGAQGWGSKTLGARRFMEQTGSC